MMRMNMDAKDQSFKTFSQMGIVVKDINQAVKNYEALGFGPFNPLPPEIKVVERFLHGEPTELKVEIRIAYVGPLEIELIQPVSGKSIWQEFLDSRGEGFNHLRILVDDLEAEAAKLEKQGFEMVYNSKFASGGGAAYFEASKLGIPYLELVQL